MTGSFKCAAISWLAITIDGSSVGQLPEELSFKISARVQNGISFRSTVDEKIKKNKKKRKNPNGDWCLIGER